MDTLIQTDTSIFLALNGLHASVWDTFMYIFSSRWVWVPAYVLTAVMLVRIAGWRSGILIVLCTAAAVALSDQTCATFIRPYVQRLRPANPDNPISYLVHIVNGYRGGSYGFPSCHAANTFAFAMTLAMIVRKRSIVITVFLWAVLNCYSRIYLGVHYPGDLLVGAAIGTIFGFIMSLVYTNLTRNIKFLRPDPDLINHDSGIYSKSSAIMAYGFIATSVLILIYAAVV